MNFRSDLALECREPLAVQPEGLECSEEKQGEISITRVNVNSEAGAQAIGKPRGRYVTIEVPPFGESAEVYGAGLDCATRELRTLLPPEGAVLVVGLGNDGITPDALGPRCCSMVLATRHLGGELAKSAGMADLRPVACFAAGVLGRTGVESGEMIAAAVRALEPAAVITVDALAARRLARLGCTIQLADSGIIPGSGVGNARKAITPAALGRPVISIGVPTVVDAATLACDLLEQSNCTLPEAQLRHALAPNGAQMMVTPREVDLLIARAAKLLGMAINCALHPAWEPEDFLMLL
ncbi:MAG: GPR endopeptidase [Oscillospiraceae bacterium]|nr:GPR endopeptidase [Oscillospiraceae bacterium]